MKVYTAVFNEGETDGVYALSVVEDPAMQDMWIALSDHPKEIELAAVDDDKHLLLGAALIPNKKIYRCMNGEEFYITFNEETIEQLAHNFIKQGHQNNSSLEHEVSLDGMSVVENWIVEDPEKDKSANFGKQYPKGTWVTMMKVDNEDMWEKAKNGEIKGFSIDALLGLEELKLKSNNNNMTKTDFLDAFRAIFSEREEVKEVEQVEVKSEEVVEVTEADTTEEVEVKVEETEEVNAIEAIKEILTQFKTDVDAKFEAIEAKFSKEEKLEEKVEELEVELSKEPEVEPIKAKPEVEVKKVKFNTPKTTKSRAVDNIAKAMGW